MANTVYENKVIEAKAKDLLTTSLNARNYMTIDDSLALSAGMTKTINTYTYTGEAEELAAGEANSAKGSITFVSNDYVVKRVQQTFTYTDEDFMKDPSIVDNMLKGANQIMVNKMVADFKTECGKATLSAPYTTMGYEAIVDGIAELNLEDETGVFTIIPNAQKKELRKDPDYVTARMGEVVYSGQVGTVSGIPVVCSKAFAEPYTMTKEAVKLFIKKDIEVEQDRDVETKVNTVVLTTYYICALVDATKICKLTK
jgi:hypothetical protein